MQEIGNNFAQKPRPSKNVEIYWAIRILGLIREFGGGGPGGI